jgi:hypothetical protein
MSGARSEDSGSSVCVVGLIGLLFVNKAAGLGSNPIEISLNQGYAVWLFVAAGMTLAGGLALGLLQAKVPLAKTGP